MEDLRAKLFEAAGIPVDPWKKSSDRGMRQLCEKMIEVAKAHRASKCVLVFESSTQADYVLRQLNAMGVSCRLEDGSKGLKLLCHWSEFPHEENADMPSINVSTDWSALTGPDLVALARELMMRNGSHESL